MPAPYDRRLNLLAESFVFVLASYLTMPLTTVCNLLIRRELGPYFSGVYGTVMLVASYAMFANLGVLSASERELPFWQGRGDLERYKRIRQSAGAFSLAAGLVAGLGIVAFAVLFRGDLDIWIFQALCVGAFLIVTQQWNDYQTTLLRITGEFVYLGKASAALAAATAVFGLAGAMLGGFHGLMASLIFVSCLRAACLTRRTRYVPEPRVDWRQIGLLLLDGVPMLGTGIVFVFAQTLDGVLALQLLGVEALGLYSLAISSTALIVGLSKAAQTVLYPRMMETYGKTQDVKTMAKYVTEPGLIVAFLLPIPVALLYLGVPLLVHAVMPRFEPGLPCLNVALIAAFFWAMLQTPGSVLVSLRRQRYLVAVLVAGMLLQSLSAWYFAGNGAGLTGIASATLLSFVPVCVAMTWLSLVSLSRRQRTEFLCWLFIPIISASLTLAILALVIPSPKGNSFLMLLWTAVSAILFMVGYAPLLWILDQKTRLLSTLLALASARFRLQKQPSAPLEG